MSSFDPDTVVENGLASRVDGLFYSKSDEKFTVRTLLDELFAGGKFRETLDVGPGPGHISEPLARCSQRITMVEKSLKYEPLLRGQFENARVIISPIEDLVFDERFDVILFSHVLYYLPEEKWLEVCTKLHSMLSQRGELLIVLNSDSGDWWRIVNHFWDEMRDHIGFHYIPSTTFKKELSKLGSVRVHSYRYQMWIDPGATWCEFVGKQILEIFDDSVLAANEQRFAEFAKAFKQIDGSYVLDMRAEIIRVRAR